MEVIKQEVLDKIASSEDISPTGKAWHEGFACALSHVGLIDSLELQTCLNAIKKHFTPDKVQLRIIEKALNVVG